MFSNWNGRGLPEYRKLGLWKFRLRFAIVINEYPRIARNVGFIFPIPMNRNQNRWACWTYVCYLAKQHVNFANEMNIDFQY